MIRNETVLTGSGYSCASEVVCQGSGTWLDTVNDDTYQFFCSEKQKSKVADIEPTSPHSSFTLQEDIIQTEWEPICESDSDCGESEMCEGLQAHMDDSKNFWIRANSC